ncbi:MAG TPA: hypothetical protein VIZ69_12315 [Thermoanaerobaculia bacterium]
MILAAALLTAAAAGAPEPSRTSLGRDLVIDRPLSGRVVAALSDVRIDAPITGDVIVWGGSVAFGPSGSVNGNLSVFGGEIHPPAGGELPVTGAVSTPGALLSLYLAEMHRPPWETPSRLTTYLGLRLIALAVWLAASLALLHLFSSPFSRAAAWAEQDWAGALLAGACGVSAAFLAAAAALALLPSAISVPVSLAFGAAAVLAKIFGMGALFLLLGQKLLRNVSAARRPAALACGFAALAAVSLLPFLGPVLWSAASIIAVGIALASRFGAPRYRVAVA